MSILNRLTTATTAFASFSELLAACSTGYAPTLYQDTRRKRILTRALNACGFRVYIGNGKFMS